MSVPGRVVVLGRNPIDIDRLIDSTEIEATEVFYFRDTYPAPNQNPLNDKLGMFTGDAWHLLIEKCLFEDMTPDSEKAQGDLAIRSHPHTTRLFEDNVVTDILSHPGHNRVDLKPGVQEMEAIK